MKKFWKIFIIAIVFLIILAIAGISLLWFTDSGRITEDETIGKGFSFDASKYPVVIDKNKYPELSASEKEISEEYGLTLQSFAEGFKKYGYEYKCFSNPELSKLSFDYLKPKQDIYLIRSYCKISGDPSPNSGMPDLMFYTRQGSIVMFYRKYVASYFTEAFNNIENLDELKEYSELYVDTLATSTDSAMNNTLLSGLNYKIDFEKECSPVSDIPELTSTVSKEGNGFIYGGLKIDEEKDVRLYYIKYSITSDGQVSKDKEEMLALCLNMGIIY